MSSGARWALGLSVALVACADAARREGEPGDVPRGAVARVGAAAVPPAEVAWAAAAADLALPAALERVVERELLVAAARDRGLDASPEVARRRAQALVQALLEAEVEGSVPREAPTEATLRAAYEARLRDYVAPERRRSRHVLARLPADASPEADAAARRAIEGLLADIAAGATLEEVASTLDRRPPEGFEWRAEEVPFLARDDDAAAPYLDALFGREAPGLIARPVRSDYGWHLIDLVEIAPARDVPFEEAEPELRDAEVVRLRRERLEGLVERLREGTRVSIDPEGLARFLALPPEALGVR